MMPSKVHFEIIAEKEAISPSLSGCNNCHSRWCCNSMGKFPAPGITLAERNAIAYFTRKENFYLELDDGLHLKSHNDGNCVFFNIKQRQCNIYPVRPMDCRIYPFDFLSIKPDKMQWILYECEASIDMDEGIIEQTLRRFEKMYYNELKAMWELDDVNQYSSVPYRKLRHVLPPSEK